METSLFVDAFTEEEYEAALIALAEDELEENPADILALAVVTGLLPPSAIFS